jgi:1,4-alpha-glucan branching enzyme
VDLDDSESSVLSFVRRGLEPSPLILVVCNFTPVPRQNYRVGVPMPGYWKEILNSDAIEYGGSGQGNLGGCDTQPVPWHDKNCSISITLPPLGAVLFEAA